MYLNIAVHYVRPKQIAYARDSFQAVVREMLESEDLDLEADPCLVSTVESSEKVLPKASSLDSSRPYRSGGDEVRYRIIKAEGCNFPRRSGRSRYEANIHSS